MTFYKTSEKFLSLTKNQFQLHVQHLAGQVSAARSIVTRPTVLGCSYNCHQSSRSFELGKFHPFLNI